MMNKKKNKRVNVRRPFEEEQIARRYRFYESGALVSLLMLIGFILLASWLLIPATFPSNLGGLEIRSWLLVSVLFTLVSLIFALYIVTYEPRIVKNHLRGGLLLVMLLIMLAVLRLTMNQGWSEYLSVVPIMITTITVTIAYGQRTALGVGGYLTLACALFLAHATDSQDKAIPILLAAGSGMGLTALTLKEIRTRSKLIEISALVAVVVFLIICLSEWWQSSPRENTSLRSIFIEGLWGGVGALAVGLLMQALLPLVERLFRKATNLTLLDYSEASKPLLKRLALEAPGTFNHSWQLGILAEAAAEAIGANGLLTRVGCYYHDVGKINKPRYFVENQAELMNQHRELSPTMSKIIIFGHVKDGLELAREYRLPKVLWHFIASHHGTTLVKYFYHEAMKRAGEHGDPAVNEVEFRYPGPKPATKEAAIVMLTDAVEGATRAMQEPTPNRIETVVHQLAMDRLQDGQFDECDLTMKDLKRIEASLVKSLCGMYHTRIAYPKIEKK